MEEQLVQFLAQTQSAAEAPRKAAEQQLLALYPNNAFPLALVSIASHDSVDAPVRLSSLIALRQYVEATWSPELDDKYTGQTFLSADQKVQVRAALVQLATSPVDSRIQNVASSVISKIAIADFPSDWPDLLPTLLQLVPSAADASLHGALKILYELVQEGFDEEQFFAVARELIGVLHTVALNGERKTALRALAVSVFRSSFDTIELVMEEHKAAVKTFAEETLSGWMSFFLDVIKTKLGEAPTAGDEALAAYRGAVALKIQTVRVLIKIRTLFPAIIAAQSVQLFSAIWDELSHLQSLYQSTYVDDDKDGRLEDSDGLAYTIDFLVLEDLDFMQSCIRAPPVRKELEKQLQEQGNSPASWVTQVVSLATHYAQITAEDEGMWEIDVNVFLAEETSVTANYTARTAAGDLVIKLGEWIPQATLDGLLLHTKSLFTSNASWRLREGALYVLSQLLNDFEDVSRPPSPQTATQFVEFATTAQQSEDDFLRARGVLISSHLIKAAGEQLQQHASQMLDQVLQAIHADKSEIVQVSCIRSLQHYLQAVPPAQTLPIQPQIIQSLQSWIAGRDMTDMAESEDLLINMVETLRDVIMLDLRICLDGEGLNVLFSVASAVPTSFQMVMIVEETFEEICEKINNFGTAAYAQLISRVLPSLIGAFDVADLTEENALAVLAAELLSELTESNPGPLPTDFVATVMPKLTRILLQGTEEELLQACAATLKHMLKHDPAQVFAWHAPEDNKAGLEVILHIVDRLLGPNLDDGAASEVGGLASELVEKAGTEKLGPYLVQLLSAVANRLATLDRSQIIQSLIGVFARLATTNPKDVVDFLAQQTINNENGLQTVMSKWLETSNLFVGYRDIRQNVTALSKLYSLHDPRLQAVMVKGDLIVQHSDRIMTRSKAKANPDQYTIIPAPLKIVKVLIDELSAAAGGGAGAVPGSVAAAAAAEEDDEESDDDDWEDEEPAFGLTKAELAKYGEDSHLVTRHSDDQTQAYLSEWFRVVGQEPGFDQVFAQLTEAERARLRTIG